MPFGANQGSNQSNLRLSCISITRLEIMIKCVPVVIQVYAIYLLKNNTNMYSTPVIPSPQVNINYFFYPENITQVWLMKYDPLVRHAEEYKIRQKSWIPNCRWLIILC